MQQPRDDAQPPPPASIARSGGRPPCDVSLILAWLALAVAVVACSSGGIWFSLLSSTPPILKASWRLVLTGLLQLPPFLAQYRSLARGDAARLSSWRGRVPLMLLTGVFLAVHFGSWSVSINLTSLSHSLLFVSTTPFLITCTLLARWAVARALDSCGGGGGGPQQQMSPAAADGGGGVSALSDAASSPSCRGACSLRDVFPASSLPPTALEIVGVLLGIGASAGLAFSVADEDAASGAIGVAPSLGGDAVATIGAATMGLYLAVGSRLRRDMPLFLYAFPVTAAAGVASAVASLAFEPGVSLFGPVSSPSSYFGFLGGGPIFGVAFGAAAVSGILGHTMANFALGRISSLVVSVCLLLEPVIGSILGAAVGVQGVPGGGTIGFGVLLMLGALSASVGERESPVLAALHAAAKRWGWVAGGDGGAVAALGRVDEDSGDRGSDDKAEARRNVPLSTIGAGGASVDGVLLVPAATLSSVADGTPQGGNGGASAPPFPNDF